MQIGYILLKKTMHLHSKRYQSHLLCQQTLEVWTALHESTHARLCQLRLVFAYGFADSVQQQHTAKAIIFKENLSDLQNSIL